MNRRQFSLSLLAASAGLAWAKTPPRPPVLDYLEGSEYQGEASQRANFLKGLDDALSLAPAELKKRRYADYTGKPNQWDLATLFKKHLLPDKASRTLGDNFYNDIKDARVRANLQALRKRLGSSS